MTTTTSMSTQTPRPLRLVTNSNASTPTADVFSSPSPSSSFQHPKRFSMIATTSFSISSPTASCFDTTKATRRKSSIGYFPPDSLGSSRRGSLIRRKSLGELHETSSSTTRGHVRSWARLTGTIPVTTSSKPGADVTHEIPARERQPLTLMEKHADLLRFIAQKESKCLELRSQLALHEAELVELKRKWQKIVNKGLERGYQPACANGGVDASSIVFDGIKEGVQGMSRLLAAGFSHTAPSSPALMNHSPNLKPRLPSIVNKSHSVQESSSSISTYATSRSGNNTGRFSQSSISSFGEDQSGIGESRSFEIGGKEGDHGNGEPHVQVLMVRDTGATPTMSPNPEFHQQRQRQEQKQPNNHVSGSLPPARSNPESVRTSVIGDFQGHTWTSEVQSTATRAYRRKSREVARLDFEHLDFSSLSPSVLLSPPSMSHSNTSSPGASPRLGSSPSPSYVELSSSRTSINDGNGLKSSSTSSLGGLAPMSSIPGIGLTAVSSPPVSSWMDSMGKKLGQLHRSSTFTKNQKRASSLLSDVTNSVVNALAPPSTSASIAQGASSCPMTADPQLPPLSSLSNLKVAPASPNPSSSGSLLDDEDENETARLGSAAVLQPVTGSSPAFSAVKKREKEDSDDEEWNW